LFDVLMAGGGDSVCETLKGPYAVTKLNSSHELKDVVELFYEAAVNPGAWTHALDGFASLAGARGAMISQFGGAAVMLPASTSVSSFATDYVEESWSRLDQLAVRSVDRKLVTGFHHSGEVYDAEEWQRDGFIQATASRYGLGPYCFGHFWGLIGDTVTLRVYRAADAAPFTTAECEALNQAFAHIRRAVSLGVQLGLSHGAGLLDGLSTVKCGAALLDARGHIYRTNAIADDILRRYAVPRNGKLAFTDGKAQLRLEGQIADAIDARLDNDSDHGDFVVIQGGHNRAHPLIIQVIPVRSTDDVFRSVRAIALFNDLNLEQGLRSDLLAAVLDLRPSEARVAALLATGRSLDEIGEELTLRRETVRSYVKNILSKARVNKQSAFVAMAARMGAAGGSRLNGEAM
jgi:DNA-binding CsgD family transcriptional regulator